jgi:small subunit ribosomal protein S9
MVTNRKVEEIWATGRRKCAIARVRIKPGTGKIVVNGKPFNTYFPQEAISGFIFQPLTVTDNQGKFDINANIDGGGTAGQAGAFRHGVARALIKYDETLRPVLKNCGMLTRDARVKERKKSGQPGARKRFQFSKR